jgi:GNAT superfamily N-acetyltransferase
LDNVGAMKIETRELSPAEWPAIEKLFGKNGACAGCWCMFWRLPAGKRFDDVKGDQAKARFRALVESGAAHGILAFVGDEPVGWCAFDRRVELPRLDRAPSLRVEDAERVWSLPCFFVRREHRGKGVARVLLAAAVEALQRHGAAIAEGYPVLVSGSGRQAAAFVYTGVPSLFEGAGFELAEQRVKGKQRYRKILAAPEEVRVGDGVRIGRNVRSGKPETRRRGA